MRGTDQSDWSILYSGVAGILLSGLLLLVICLPLSYVSATLAGDDPLVTILLLRSGGAMASFLAGPAFGDLTYAELATVSAFLAMIGASALCAPLLYAVGRREGLVKLLTLIYGMLLGLSFASAWFEWSNTGSIDWLAPKAGEIAYLYLAFLAAEAIKVALADKELVALPYLYAIDGLFGTVAVLIIHVGYDPSFSSLLLGPFFLIAVAIAILASEWIFLRPATIFFVGLGQVMLDPELERSLHSAPRKGWSRHKSLLGQVGIRIREASRLSYQRRVKLIEGVISKVMRKIPRRRRKSRPIRLNWPITAAVCAGNLLFLLIAGLMARLLL